MIVFWRLFLAYYLADLVLYGRKFFEWHTHKKFAASLTHGLLFCGLCYALAWDYLNLSWPFLGIIPMKGYLCIALFTVFHVLTDTWFYVGNRFQFRRTFTFLLHDAANLIFLFLCVPLDALAQTGRFATEPWMIFFVGLVLSTKVTGTLIFVLEKDLYGRDYPTIDEEYLTMLKRAIFFLLMLLPGWRWLFLVLAWWGACWYARKERMLDMSNLSLYVGSALPILIGFCVRLRFYFYV